MDMDDLPTCMREELKKALVEMKNGKVGGGSGILHEMLKAACCEDEFLDALMDLVEDVWRESCVPRDWSDVVLVPIPKKWDLSNCDIWRGLSLLVVVGNVVARILQKWLLELAKDELLELQCAFRKGRGCTDTIFTMHQLVDNSWEKSLKKTYDSVP